MLRRPDFDTNQWAQENFADASLGDKRRSKRLVEVVSQIVDMPAGSMPQMSPLWKDLKATYRLLDMDQVTLQSVTGPHRKRIAQRGGTQLILSDTCHIDFGAGRQVRGAGPVGPGNSVGFLLHSALAYNAKDKSILGVAGQIAHTRKKDKNTKPSKESERGKQWSESRLWTDLFTQVGPSTDEVHYIHVCDSAADNYESFFTAIEELDSDVVIRCGRAHRKVFDSSGKKRSIREVCRNATVYGTYELFIPQGNQRKARTAKIEVASEKIRLPQARYCSEKIKQSDCDGFDLTVIVAREVDAPTGVEPIQWVLLTSLPVESFADALEVIGYYESRWAIEEWHKAIKTGCKLEDRQHRDIDRLLPLTGICSVVAVLLLQLREASRREPNRPATELVPSSWINLLMVFGKLRRRPKTSEELWRAIARLGGFLGRRYDGKPGWITIWRGWQRLHEMLRGYQYAQQLKNCG